MNILGIFDGHNASSCLLVNGKPIAMVQEERFTKRKNDKGYPENAINYCLSSSGISGNDIDYVAVTSIHPNPYFTMFKREASFSVDDFVDENNFYWKPTLLKNQDVKDYWLKYVNNKNFQFDSRYDWNLLPEWPKGFLDPTYFKQIRIKAISEHLKIAETKIHFIDHHYCHAAYAGWADKLRTNNSLIFVNDGGGDNANGTVSIWDNGIIKELERNNVSNVGRIYRYITLLLGMKIGEHEYKVMGLAPYANEKEKEKAYNKAFQDLFRINSLLYEPQKHIKDHYQYFKELLEGARFDGISAAVQKMSDDTITRWVKYALKKTGKNRVVFTGGVSMNVKTNYQVSLLDNVFDIYIPPSGGDESLSLGACYHLAQKMYKKSGKDPRDYIEPLSNIYLGPSYNLNDWKNTIQNCSNQLNGMIIKDNVLEKDIAFLIKNGIIVAKSSGKMEFGSRALGNRSILANGYMHGIVEKLNRQIKYRDFWMPFAPVIKKESQDKYLKNINNIDARYMTISFPSTTQAQQDIPNALHPADASTRPQVLSYDENPQYYTILDEYEKLTGCGGMINTSFNLHGHPIALDPFDSIHVFVNSELDALWNGNTLIARPSKTLDSLL